MTRCRARSSACPDERLGRLPGCAAELTLVERGIEAAGLEQLGVRALGDESAVAVAIVPEATALFYGSVALVAGPREIETGCWHRAAAA
jgi:hypothetical protein